jgi:hypothetical protein
MQMGVAVAALVRWGQTQHLGLVAMAVTVLHHPLLALASREQAVEAEAEQERKERAVRGAEEMRLRLAVQLDQ